MSEISETTTLMPLKITKNTDDKDVPIEELYPQITNPNHTIPWNIKWCNIFIGVGSVFMFGMTNGTVNGYSSPSLPELKQVGLLVSNSDASWFVSIVSIGAIAGSPIGGWSITHLGRQRTILIECLPLILGWLVIISAQSAIQLIIGRFICGLVLGCGPTTNMVYVTETTCPQLRGRLSTLHCVGYTTGLFASYCFGLVLDWRWQAVICASPVALQAICIIFLPESPRWLLLKNRKGEALEVLSWLHKQPVHSEIVQYECCMIETAIATESKELSWRTFLTTYYKPLRISVMLLIFQSLSGHAPIVRFAVTIFHQAGFKDAAGTATVLNGLSDIMGTVLSLLLIDHAGRRCIFISAGVWLAISCGTLGLYFYLIMGTTVENLAWLALTSTVVNSFVHSFGWGTIPWMTIGELFPVEAKGKASSIGSISAWLSSFIVGQTFLFTEDLIYPFGTFWLYGICSVIVTIFAIFCLPETKRKTLEQIQTYLKM